MKSCIVPEERAGIRLDRVLVDLFPGLTRTYAASLIDGKEVLVNGVLQKKRYLVDSGDCITLSLPLPVSSLIIPEKMDFSVLYEDEDFFVINKPPHLVVHPAPGNSSGTFVNGFLSHLGSTVFDDPIRPGIVHRLDKDTSGVLLAAKNREALYAVSRQFHDRQVEKEYFAVVFGECAGYEDINEPIGRDSKNRKKMAIVENGRVSRTEVWGLKSSSGYSFVKAHPLTGRTHQIRVHLRFLGLSILGDDLYGQKEINGKWGVRQMLHCGSLKFLHPKKKTMMHIKAPFFQDMTDVLKKLQFLDIHESRCSAERY